MEVYKDNGYGITADSRKFAGKILERITEPEARDIILTRKMGRYTVFVYFKDSHELHLSGFNWGYGGEGPHGLLWLFEKLGVPLTIEDISRWDMDTGCRISFISGKWEVRQSSSLNTEP